MQFYDFNFRDTKALHDGKYPYHTHHIPEVECEDEEGIQPPDGVEEPPARHLHAGYRPALRQEQQQHHERGLEVMEESRSMYILTMFLQDFLLIFAPNITIPAL